MMSNFSFSEKNKRVAALGAVALGALALGYLIKKNFMPVYT